MNRASVTVDSFVNAKILVAVRVRMIQLYIMQYVYPIPHFVFVVKRDRSYETYSLSVKF